MGFCGFGFFCCGFGFFLIKLFHCANHLNFLDKKREYTRVFKDKSEAFQLCQNKSKASLSRLTCTLLHSFKRRLYLCTHFVWGKKKGILKSFHVTAQGINHNVKMGSKLLTGPVTRRWSFGVKKTWGFKSIYSF